MFAASITCFAGSPACQVGEIHFYRLFYSPEGDGVLMNADFLAVLESWEREKGISRDVLLNAVQEALLTSAKKAVGPAGDLRVEIDPKSGDIKAYAKLIVSDKVVNRQEQISQF